MSAEFGRCYDPANRGYPNYGGRGINVHAPWHDDRASFLAYLMSLPGWDDPKAEIDRIDNERGYEPGNLRFVNRRIQMRNTRLTNRVVYQGVDYSASDFRERFCPRYRFDHTVARKLESGCTPEDVIAQQERCRGAYKRFEWQGQRYTLREINERFCPELPYSTLEHRTSRGWSMADIINTPKGGVRPA